MKLIMVFLLLSVGIIAGCGKYNSFEHQIDISKIHKQEIELKITNNQSYCTGGRNSNCRCQEGYFKFTGIPGSVDCIPNICKNVRGDTMVGDEDMPNIQFCEWAVRDRRLKSCDVISYQLGKDICTLAYVGVTKNMSACARIDNDHLKEECGLFNWTDQEKRFEDANNTADAVHPNTTSRLDNASHTTVDKVEEKQVLETSKNKEINFVEFYLQNPTAVRIEYIEGLSMAWTPVPRFILLGSGTAYLYDTRSREQSNKIETGRVSANEIIQILRIFERAQFFGTDLGYNNRGLDLTMSIIILQLGEHVITIFTPIDKLEKQVKDLRDSTVMKPVNVTREVCDGLFDGLTNQNYDFYKIQCDSLIKNNTKVA